MIHKLIFDDNNPIMERSKLLGEINKIYQEVDKLSITEVSLVKEFEKTPPVSGIRENKKNKMSEISELYKKVYILDNQIKQTKKQKELAPFGNNGNFILEWDCGITFDSRKCKRFNEFAAYFIKYGFPIKMEYRG